MEVNRRYLDFAVVGKIFSKRKFQSSAVKSAMRAIWKFAKSIEVRDIGENTYVFSFDNGKEKNHVLASGPNWNFNRCLMIVSDYDNKPGDFSFDKAVFWVQIHDLTLNLMSSKVGFAIGNVIGEVMEVESRKDGIAWGKYLRVKVLIDVNKPLKRGVMLRLPGNGRRLWAEFRYERLPNFCYRCGVLNHVEQDCDKEVVSAILYGAWLRASSTVTVLGRDMVADDGQEIDDDELLDLEKEQDLIDCSKDAGKCSVVAKIFSRKKFQLSAINSAMRTIWKFVKSIEVRDMGENIYIFSFDNVKEKDRVLSSGPNWSFNRCLMIVSDYGDFSFDEAVFWVQIHDLTLNLMSSKVGFAIGNVIGKAIEVESRKDGIAWGKYLRVQVLIDVNKPLKRGVMLRLPGKGLLWAYCKYERLPNFCYRCGVLNHTEQDCDKKIVNAILYGDWLRVSSTMAVLGRDMVVDHRQEIDNDDLLDLEIEQDLIDYSKDAGKCSVVGKIFSKKKFQPSAVKSAMSAIWKFANSIEVRDLGENIYVFSFDNDKVKDRVLALGPNWSFNRCLMIASDYHENKPGDFSFDKAVFWVHIHDLTLNLMSSKVGFAIGNVIGKAIEVGGAKNGIVWGKYLRVKVLIDVNKPLRRGIMLRLPDKGGKLWAYFRYERLLDFCYHCGVLNHVEQDCDKEVSDIVYGDWLRSSSSVTIIGRGIVPDDGQEIDNDDVSLVKHRVNPSAIGFTLVN